MFGAVFELAGDGKPVGGVEPLCFGVHTAGRGEIGNMKEFAEAFEAVTKYLETTFMLGIEGLAEIIKKGYFGLFFLEVFEILPFLWLGFLNEGDEDGRLNGAFSIKLYGVSLGISGSSQKMTFYGCLKSLFCMLARH